MDSTRAAALAAHIEGHVALCCEQGVLRLDAIVQWLTDADLWPEGNLWPLAQVTAYLQKLPVGLVAAKELILTHYPSLRGPHQAGGETLSDNAQVCAIEVEGGLPSMVGVAFALAALKILSDQAQTRRAASLLHTPHALKQNGSPPWTEILAIAPKLWDEAMAKTHGALELLINQPFAPTISISPTLAPSYQHSLGRLHGRKALGFLAQMGLAQRPWHLWLGPPIPKGLLSPYVRDLGPRLMAWAEEQRDLVGEPLAQAWDRAVAQADAQALMALTYGITEAFVAQNPELGEERRSVERAGGIITCVTDLAPFEVIDLGRVQADLWDTRLPGENTYAAPNPAQAPLLICLPYSPSQNNEQALAAQVARLAQSLGTTAQSIAVCQPGLLTDPAVKVVTPHSMLTAAGHHPYLFDLPQHLIAAGGAVSIDALPCPLTDAWAWTWATAVPPEEETLPAAAVVGGGTALAATLLRLRARGALPHHLPVIWGVYDSLAPWMGQDAFALAWLQRILTPCQSAPAAKPKPQPKKPTAGLRA